MRLDKYLAESSVGTRKVIKSYIREGKITVNDKMTRDPAMEIAKDFDIVNYLDEKCTNNICVHIGKVYYMFHKPSDCITARHDQNKKTVLDYFQRVNTNGLFPVGRLDKDTEGLLFLTNDGEFNHRLMFPDQHVEKTYFFWAFGSLDEEEKQQLEAGIHIGVEEPITKAAKIEILKEGMYNEFKEEMNVKEITFKKKNLYKQNVVSGYLTISEGRKHQVKRMLKAVGCYVFYLKRISIGDVILDESLEKGHFRMLTEKEIDTLCYKYSSNP